MRTTRSRAGWLAGLAAAMLAGVAAAGTVHVSVQDSAGKPLAGAVVFLESREAKALARPLAGTEIAQRAKRFEPEVTVVTVGSAVTFPNQDTVRHHVYSFSPVKTFELKLYIGTPANPVVFDKPGIAVLGCNIHDQMAAWVVIVETPYFGRSAASGQVALANVPAGSYRLRVWHPGLAVGAPAADQALAVGAADQATVFKLAGVTP
ncbi:methylamine utilization protein [Pseudorhodoferax sp.]|uniref:methylamine utilization protein n=1 Tax=Pseudorhodoferax sp. TaxID=1993553 RepID=UPI002DD61F21|nr:methylamine utilization protein [Pseudorhodoferax sp.]